MTPKTIFGFTYKNNNVSKSAHISNVFKKSLDMLKSERIKGLDLKSVPTKNKVLLRGCGNRDTCTSDNTSKVIVKSDVNLSHRLMGQIQPPMVVGVSPSMVVVRPQVEDIKTQLPPMEGVKPIQLTSLMKVKHLQTFTQIEETENINHLAPYPLMDRASPQSEEKVYPPLEVGNIVRPQTEVGAFTSMVEKSFTPLGKTSNHKFIANLRRCHYPNRALSKILKLALTGYSSNGVHSAPSGFFVRNISMHSHIVMAKLWRDTFECAGNRLSLSVNPFQLCHHHLTVISKAPTSNGVHSHA